MSFRNDFDHSSIESHYNDQHYNELVQHMKLREGYRLDAYYDTADPPELTIGIGHKVTGEERDENGRLLNLKEHDVVSPELVQKWFDEDISEALYAAKSQASMLGLDDNPEFINALTSVNFQLGTQWHVYKFPKAFGYMKEGDFEEAALEIRRNGQGVEPSKWLEQTPKRVGDFQEALMDVHHHLHPECNQDMKVADGTISYDQFVRENHPDWLSSSI